jgi:hypothetical protein
MIRRTLLSRVPRLPSLRRSTIVNFAILAVHSISIVSLPGPACPSTSDLGYWCANVWRSTTSVTAHLSLLSFCKPAKHFDRRHQAVRGELALVVRAVCGGYVGRWYGRAMAMWSRGELMGRVQMLLVCITVLIGGVLQLMLLLRVLLLMVLMLVRMLVLRMLLLLVRLYVRMIRAAV